MSSKTLPTPARRSLTPCGQTDHRLSGHAMPRPTCRAGFPLGTRWSKFTKSWCRHADARAFRVSRGQFFRIVSIEGPRSATSVPASRRHRHALDPYTNLLLSARATNRCCPFQPVPRACRRIEGGTVRGGHHIHDVLNVFMCTGFTKDTHNIS